MKQASAPPQSKEGRNLLQAAGSIGLFTTVSKALGLLRETLLAAVFGVGPVITAFNYSSILPGFFMAILGGVNGPLQVMIMAFLSKHNEKEGQAFIGKVSTVIALVCGGLSLALFAFSGPIIDAMAPGLLMDCSTNGHITRNLAILQLKVMAPCALLAGLIGVGFGSLSAAGVYEVLSLSPSLSSMSIIVAVVVHMALFASWNVSSINLTGGSISLALGVTVGALAQCLWQAKAHHDLGLVFLLFQSVNPLKDKDVQEVVMVLLPAIVGSGMLQFATFTDLYFASFIPGAAAGLGYANLLVMAPLGILSSSILLPMMSLFARLTKPSDWTELKDRVSEGLLLLLAATLPMTAIVISLSRPIVEVALQRLAFDASASALVSSLVVYYVAGSSVYLARDLLTQLFYALGDGHIPFFISVGAILTNALLDWFLVQVAAFGPEGLVLATTLVNAVSAVALLMLLSRKLHGLPLKQWMYTFSIMVGASILSGVVTQFSYKWWTGVFSSIRAVGQVGKACCCIFVASSMGIATFYTIFYISRRGSSEIESLSQLFQRQLMRPSPKT